MVSDFTRVYLHLEHAGQEAHVEVLNGPYLAVEHVRWMDTQNVVLCVAGRTHIFMNHVMLTAGGLTVQIAQHLEECTDPPR